MLISEYGIVNEDAVVELDTRRAPSSIDPKHRVTMAIVLQTALTSFETSDPLGTPLRRVAPVSYLNRTILDPAGESSWRESAA